MESSILKTIRVENNIANDCDSFDDQLIPLINEAFSTLWQVGVGPKNGFAISGVQEVWDDYTRDIIQIGWIKTYIGASVRLEFDPPASSIVKDAQEKKMQESLWRLNVYVDPPEEV